MLPRNLRTEKYDPDTFYHLTMGPGGIPLIDEMAQTMDLQPGMRVLDLGCGMALSSIFLAREYDIQVVAFDLWISAEDNWKRIRQYQLEDSIIPIRGEASHLPFAQGYFDAIFSMDAYQYFGTNDLYLGYLAPFLHPAGTICIGGPAITEETYPEVPEAFRPLYEKEPELYAIHSAEWWKTHWEKSGVVENVESRTLERGIDYWLETAEWTNARGIAPPQGASDEDLELFRNHGEEFFTIHITQAQRKG